MPAFVPAPAKKLVQQVPSKTAKKTNSGAEQDDFEEWKKSKMLLKPRDQLELSDAELKDVIPKVLQTMNMQQPQGLVIFHFQLREFVPLPQHPSLVVVVSQLGNYLHRDSDDARKLLLSQGFDISEFGKIQESQMSLEEERPVERPAETNEEEEGGGAGEGEGENKAEGVSEQVEEETKEAEEEVRPAKGKKLTNQFNFCERASLTYNNPYRDRDVQTTPPPLLTFSAHVLQWIIYDGYQQDYAEQQLAKERERELRERSMMQISKHQPAPKKRAGKAQLSEAVQGRVYECWKTIERMINMNTYNYIAQDYRYWEDPSDEHCEGEGTLLPLWKLTYDKTKKNTVTDFCWNPHYYDLFAVSYGYLDFTKPTREGAVCLFTFKNPSYPDYICMTESAAMCVNIHKDYPYMIVVGLYDGNVLIYNIQANPSTPAYKSNSVEQKHGSIVWEVKWVPNMPDGELNFYSVASDGKVNHWVLMQSHLTVTTIFNLYLDMPPVLGPDGTYHKNKSCATCIAFHPTDSKIYMIGTEEGLIYKCSIAYSASYLITYKAHHLPVHRIDFNKLNSSIFLSCSADWRIKIWEDNRLEPLYVFDLGSSIGDVKWAPYSTTVFGAVTTKGKAYVYDLNINQHKPICEQGIVSRKNKHKLTRNSFNHKLPIIVCGDDRGCVTSLKLSPNLRIPCKPPKKMLHLDQNTLQIMKLDKLLSTAREPPIIDYPPDPAAGPDA